MSHEFQKTVAKTETLTFSWNVEGFDALRKLARLKALPSKDRLFSPEFGNNEAGHWKVALFPYGEREAQKHVSLYLFCDKKHKRVAEFSMVVIDAEFREMSETFLGEEATFFTAESNSWGWHEFLSVETDDELRPYLVDGDCLRVKIRVKVYTGVVDEKSPRLLFNIVQNRCENSDEESEDDDHECDSAQSENCHPNVNSSEAVFSTTSNEVESYYKGEALSSRANCRNPRAESCSDREDAEAAQRHNNPISACANNMLLSAWRPLPGGRQQPSSSGAPGLSVISPPTVPFSAANDSSSSDAVLHSCSLESQAPLASARQERRSVRRNSFATVATATNIGAGVTPNKALSFMSQATRRRARRRFSYCCCSSSSAQTTGADPALDSVEKDKAKRCRVGSMTSSTSEVTVELNLRGKSLQNDVARFALDPRVQDLTVVCEGRRFMMNRFLLGARSEVFRAMLFGKFIEGKLDEIVLTDIPLSCVEDFLTFVATDHCPILSLPVRCGCPNGTRGNAVKLESDSSPKALGANKMTDDDYPKYSSCDATTCRGCVISRDAIVLTPRLLQLMIAADKYQILELRSRCIQALARCICPRTVLDVLTNAERLQCDELADACNFYMKRNASKLDKIVDEVRRRRNRSTSFTSIEESRQARLNDEPVAVAGRIRTAEECAARSIDADAFRVEFNATADQAMSAGYPIPPRSFQHLTSYSPNRSSNTAASYADASVPRNFDELQWAGDSEGPGCPPC